MSDAAASNAVKSVIANDSRIIRMARVRGAADFFKIQIMLIYALLV